MVGEYVSMIVDGPALLFVKAFLAVFKHKDYSPAELLLITFENPCPQPRNQFFS